MGSTERFQTNINQNDQTAPAQHIEGTVPAAADAFYQFSHVQRAIHWNTTGWVEILAIHDNPDPDKVMADPNNDEGWAWVYMNAGSSLGVYAVGIRYKGAPPDPTGQLATVIGFS